MNSAGISRERYQSLIHFSRQYADYLRRGIPGPDAWKVLLMERAAQAAQKDLAGYILENAATGRTFEQIRPPCGRNQFYEARKRYFAELNRMLDAETPLPDWWIKTAGARGFE